MPKQDDQCTTDYLIQMLNELVKQPGGKDLYRKFGKQGIISMPGKVALALEAEYPELGIVKVEGEDCFEVTIASLLATITDVLVGARLAFKLEPTNRDETIGFTWWTLEKEAKGEFEQE